MDNSISNPPNPVPGGVYTPVDPLPGIDDLSDDDVLVDDPALDQSGREMPGNAPEQPEQPALDGDDAAPQPESKEQEADFEYDEQDVDQ